MRNEPAKYSIINARKLKKIKANILADIYIIIWINETIALILVLFVDWVIINKFLIIILEKAENKYNCNKNTITRYLSE